MSQNQTQNWTTVIFRLLLAPTYLPMTDMSLPFISAPGPWYSEYGQPGWICPWGIDINIGNGSAPYRTYLTNSSNSSPLKYTIAPVTTLKEWGPYDKDPPTTTCFFEELSVTFGNVYYFVVQDANQHWAWSEGVTMQFANASTQDMFGCLP